MVQIKYNLILGTCHEDLKCIKPEEATKVSSEGSRAGRTLHINGRPGEHYKDCKQTQD